MYARFSNLMIVCQLFRYYFARDSSSKRLLALNVSSLLILATPNNGVAAKFTRCGTCGFEIIGCSYSLAGKYVSFQAA